MINTERDDSAAAGKAGAGSSQVQRRAVIALSLANLLHFQIWTQYLTFRKSDAFTMELPPTPGQYMGLVACVLCEALLFFSAATIMSTMKGRVAALGRVAFFIVLLIPLESTRQVLFQICRVFRRDVLRVTAPNVLTISIVVAVAALLIYNKRYWEPRLIHFFSVLFLICSPMILFTFSQAVFQSFGYNPSPFLNQPSAPPIPEQQDKPRVMIALYDEWDYRLTFEDRKGGVAMPQIDRLRSESLFTTHAHPPGRDTIVAVPSLLTGTVVSRDRSVDVAEMEVNFEGTSAWTPIDQAPNLFREAREAGFNASVIGWYLPYCRIFGKYLTSCEWKPTEQKYNETGGGFFDNLINQPRALFELKLDAPFEIKFVSLFGQPLTTKRRIRTYQELTGLALEKAVDPQVGLLYLHVAVPHSPYFYDSRTGQFDLNTTAASGYWENLALVDRNFGDLRRKMESAGMWDNTTIVLTADHFFRTADKLDGKIDPRVPLIIKMAGSNVPLQFDSPFNTVLLKDLVMAVLRRQISTAQEALSFISQRAANQPESLRTKDFLP